MYPASSEAKNATAAAISSGRARRRNGIALTSASPRRGLAWRVASIIGVSVGPGHTTLTRMPWRATSRAAAPLDHPVEHRPRACDGPAEVHRDDAVPRLLRALHERLDHVPAGAGD